jgi:hypothetical protein
MKIKSQHVLRSLLLAPYLIWGTSLAFNLLVDRLIADPDATPAILDALVGVTSFYTIGILLWGIPYTILVVGLLLWSIRKPTSTIHRVFVFSPILMSVLMTVETALVAFWSPQAPFLEELMDFLQYTLVAVIPTLVFGYGFVGAGIIINKATKRLNLMNEGETI